MEHSSTKTVESRILPGVSFVIQRMSFGRRLELMRRARELGTALECHSAGSTIMDKLQAAESNVAIEGLYLEWGLSAIQGLIIDGAPANAQTLLAAGPEELCREIIQEIRQECGLTDEERKN